MNQMNQMIAKLFSGGRGLLDDTELTLLLLCLASQSLLDCSVINFIGVILTDTVGPGQLVGRWEKWPSMTNFALVILMMLSCDSRQVF